MIDTNKIYAEAHKAELAELISKNFICCDEATDRTYTLLMLSSKKSAAIIGAILNRDDCFFDVLKMLAAFHFEAGRLYGRQQIVDETLQEIK